MDLSQPNCVLLGRQKQSHASPRSVARAIAARKKKKQKDQKLTPVECARMITCGLKGFEIHGDAESYAFAKEAQKIANSTRLDKLISAAYRDES